ncbi:HAMP domain-containing sensor histidine kinase [Helicobacter sp. MIT 14-3879]|uniref:sensor histidine kinase n=1 Tax=Helicobacter sp. MIT 14-3879 TaxID=2040649 RepID=UPI000E1FA932|nr:HAMP domain-containing sensor histidine kinase [Helicobacter sp. MIT 14-3879]RDU61305.1 two-component sensor histidine kinase [Helicobacter sp. MIT 14-3879]
MRQKIFTTIFVITLSVVCAANLYLIYYTQAWEQREIFNILKIHAKSLETSPKSLSSLSNLSNYPYHITLFKENGEVLYELNELHNDETYNNKFQNKLAQAFREGESNASYYSKTLHKRVYSLYLKVSLDNTSLVLRISLLREYLSRLLLSLLPIFLLELVLSFIVSFVVSLMLTRKIIAPLESLTFDNIIRKAPYTELKPLFNVIKNEYNIITHQLKGLEKNQNQILLLAQNMSDGLIFLNKIGKVLLVNEHAKKYFPDIFPSKIIHKCKDSFFVQKVLFHLSEFKRYKRQQNQSIQISYKECEFLFCPTYSKGKFKGMIIILRDMDAKLKAQKLRKEFSANVTHELKTPLTSILTSSEMMKNELVAREDFPQFINVIESEAKRLLEMIDEIFKLSFLDENQPITMRRLNLKPLVKEVYQHLKLLAEKKDISFCVILQDCFVLGNVELLKNLIYNLCDNAIKYNKTGGFVNLELRKKGEKALLIVRDNGIGIAKDLQERIFERFFCVDKSRSKKLGGTGLGLSIVKSVARFHQANITLQSKLGEGSEFVIEFMTVI